MAVTHKVVVRLTSEQRQIVDRLVHTGKQAAALRRHAQILLKADLDGPAWSDEQIAETLDICCMTVMRVRHQFVAEGLDATLHSKKPSGRQYRKLDGKQEAQLVTLACSPAPPGTGTLDHETAGRAPRRTGSRGRDRPGHGVADAKKTISSPGSSSHGSCRRRRTRPS